MPAPRFQIEPDIRRAATLPRRFYHSPQIFDQCREQLFARSWQFITGAEDVVRRPGDALPFQFMDNFIEEPLICRRTRRISGRLFRPIISAYYFWLFPNLMFNFYPWGLSLNIVRPLQPDRPKVSFRAYIFDESKLHAGAGADVDLVEREDEAVVEQVQLGTRSRFYRQGRFSPNMEQGVHQFHQLVAGLLG